MQYALLLNETAVLEGVGYFFAAIALAVLVIIFLLGRLIFSIKPKTTFVKIIRAVYLVVVGGFGLLMFASLSYF